VGNHRGVFFCYAVLPASINIRGEPKMAKTPDPYLAVALQPAFKNARNREDIMDNIRSVSVLMDVAM